MESPIEAVTKVPIDAASSEEITLNVTILNLAYTSELASKYSLKYNSTSTSMLYLVSTGTYTFFYMSMLFNIPHTQKNLYTLVQSINTVIAIKARESNLHIVFINCILFYTYTYVLISK